ncbi:MAG: hypothetical protein K6G71_03310 [Clostridiales bacterium]|nr:hypothetical protein [Clostridiales bacterium]
MANIQDNFTPMVSDVPPDALPIAVAVMILLGNYDYAISTHSDIHYLLAPFYAGEDPGFIKKNGRLDTKKCKYTKLLQGGDTITRKQPVSAHKNSAVYKNIREHCRELNWRDLIKYIKTMWGKDSDIPEENLPLDEILDPQNLFRIMQALHRHGNGGSMDPRICWTIAQRFITDKNSAKKTVRFFKNNDETSAEMERIVTETGKNRSNSFYVSGNTLEYLLSGTPDASLFERLLEQSINGAIKHLYIFLPSHTAFSDSETSTGAAAGILKLVRNLHSAKGQGVEATVVFLYDLHIPFCIMNDREMLYRDTFLLTGKKDMNGAYELYPADNPQYKGLKNYMDLLLENAYEKTDFSSTPTVRNIIDGSKAAFAKVGFKKCTTEQLSNYSRSTIEGRNVMPVVETPVDTLFNDNTQVCLLNYVGATSDLMNKVVRMHDPKGWATVTPCYDFGLPANTLSLCGGFASGALYDWSCNVPLVFPDAAAYPAATSVFEFTESEWSALGFTEHGVAEQKEIIDGMLLTAVERGHGFNFRSGSNFLCLAGDKYDNHHYLILHSSSGGRSSDAFTLFPGKDSWFRDKIHVLEENGRRIRYIRGETAMRFADFAKQHGKAVDGFHKFVFDCLIGKYSAAGTKRPLTVTKRHNGMPTASSVQAGCYISDRYDTRTEDLIFPIIHDVENEIVLFKRAKDAPEKTHMLADTHREISLIPNLYGCAMNGLTEIETQTAPWKLVLKNGVSSAQIDMDCELNVFEALGEDAYIRKAGKVGDFIKGAVEKGYMAGSVYRKLKPVFVYDKNGCGNPFKMSDPTKWMFFDVPGGMKKVGGG